MEALEAELAGQQKERLRISKEIHDDIGASLTAIGLLSEVLKTRPAFRETAEVHKISELSATMVTAMNEIIWSLNTRNDSLNGLVAYIRAYAAEFAETACFSLQTDIQEAATDRPINGSDRRNLFLVVKEALHNVAKHARATQVQLHIQAGGPLSIRVCDNGQGFSENNPKNGNGLANMQQRMAGAGGSCRVTSGPAGTCVELTYPV